MITVIVGNIGTVYNGNDEQEAHNVFNRYVLLSNNSMGRAAMESVTMMINGEITREYTGEIDQINQD